MYMYCMYVGIFNANISKAIILKYNNNFQVPCISFMIIQHRPMWFKHFLGVFAHTNVHLQDM